MSELRDTSPFAPSLYCMVGAAGNKQPAADENRAVTLTEHLHEPNEPNPLYILVLTTWVTMETESGNERSVEWKTADGGKGG